MLNADIKTYAKTKGVKQWEIAECLGIHEAVLSRKMRHELSQEEKEEFKKAVDQVKAEGVVNG